MLHVSIHAGPVDGVTRANRTDWLDIGYEKLDSAADYKIVAFNVGEGATPEVILRSYPRWSASLWDLVARAIVLTRYPADEAREELPPIEPGGKRCAFATVLSAVIEHHPSRGIAGRRLASMEIRRHGWYRNQYRAKVEEDLLKENLTQPFEFAPKRLSPSELVLHAALHHLQGSAQALPCRPPLRLPVFRTEMGKPYVLIHRLYEPARTGFLRWLLRNSEPPENRSYAPDGIAPAAIFNQFLKAAV